jgi:hypothetical protein
MVEPHRDVLWARGRTDFLELAAGIQFSLVTKAMEMQQP